MRATISMTRAWSRPNLSSVGSAGATLTSDSAMTGNIGGNLDLAAQAVLEQ
jgi:hypothetical protein